MRKLVFSLILLILVSVSFQVVEGLNWYEEGYAAPPVYFYNFDIKSWNYDGNGTITVVAESEYKKTIEFSKEIMGFGQCENNTFFVQDEKGNAFPKIEYGKIYTFKFVCEGAPADGVRAMIYVNHTDIKQKYPYFPIQFQIQIAPGSKQLAIFQRDNGCFLYWSKDVYHNNMLPEGYEVYPITYDDITGNASVTTLDGICYFDGNNISECCRQLNIRSYSFETINLAEKRFFEGDDIRYTFAQKLFLFPQSFVLFVIGILLFVIGLIILIKKKRTKN